MTQPIIIIEGQDRCGKSFLANQLANHFGPGVIKHHSGSPPKHLAHQEALRWEENNYWSLMDVFNNAADTNAVVIDRFHIGCPVFGRRYRNYSGALHIDFLERYMQLEDNVFLFLLTDNADELFKRDDGLSFEKTAAEFGETAAEFVYEFGISIIPNKLHINITKNGGFEQTLPTVLRFIEGKL